MIIEKEVSKRFSQDPITAPSVKTNETFDRFISRESQQPSDEKQESHYLFEKIDSRLLKADEELIKRIHA